MAKYFDDVLAAALLCSVAFGGAAYAQNVG